MKTLLLIALQLGASGADAYYTDRNARLPRHYETNPIARQFMGSTAGRVTFFAGNAGIRIALPVILRRRGHKRLADLVAIEGIAENTQGAGYSAVHGRGVR